MARVAFCQDVMVEYMGFMSISAVLKEAGHAVEVFFDDQAHEDRFLRQLERSQPDVVGFSILTPSVPWALRLARRVKDEIGSITVFGNVHAITQPDIINDPAADIVCIGEGEYPMRELCDAIDHGEDYSHIKGFWVKTRDGIVKNPMRQNLVDIDSLPFHDRPLYNKYAFFRRSHYLRLLAGRGCPFSCSFCSNPMLRDHYGGKRYIRKCHPERAIAEIEHTVKNHPAKVTFLFFIDEVFWLNNNWLREFLTLYKERIRLPFSANFKFGPIGEQDIRLLAEAGASVMGLAIESGDEKQRCTLMNKPVKDHHALRVAGWMHKYGIQFGSSAFFGLPGDTFENHVKRLQFYRKLNPAYLWTTFFQPYPSVPLSQHPEVQKYMPVDKPFDVTLHHNMYLDVPDRNRLVNLKKVYFLCMKSPRLEPFLLWLTKFRIPILFDALFFLHFTYYAFKFEHVSLFQWLVHIKIFALDPIIHKKRRRESRSDRKVGSVSDTVRS